METNDMIDCCCLKAYAELLKSQSSRCHISRKICPFSNSFELTLQQIILKRVPGFRPDLTVYYCLLLPDLNFYPVCRKFSRLFYSFAEPTPFLVFSRIKSFRCWTRITDRKGFSKLGPSYCQTMFLIFFVFDCIDRLKIVNNVVLG